MERPKEPVQIPQQITSGRYVPPLWNYNGEALSHRQAFDKYEQDRTTHWNFLTRDCKTERDFMMKWLEEIFLHEGARATSNRWQEIASKIFEQMGNDASTKAGRATFNNFRLDSPEVRAHLESLSSKDFVDVYTQIVRRWFMQM